jgi:hypothetical protein
MDKDIILKSERLEGVDKTLFSYEQFQSVPLVKTRVTTAMYKSGNTTYVGTKERLVAGEVIRIGNLQLKYRVISARRFNVKGGLYTIRKVESAPITQLDLDNGTVGSEVRILSRRTDYFKRTRLKL